MAVALRTLIGEKKVLFLAASGASWFLLAHAAARAHCVIVGVHPKIGKQDAQQILNETKAAVVFCDSQWLGRLGGFLLECPEVKMVIWDTKSTVPEDVERFGRQVADLKMELGGGVRVYKVAELLEVGGRCLARLPFLEMKDAEKRVWGIFYPQLSAGKKGMISPPVSITEGQASATGVLFATSRSSDLLIVKCWDWYRC